MCAVVCNAFNKLVVWRQWFNLYFIVVSCHQRFKYKNINNIKRIININDL